MANRLNFTKRNLDNLPCPPKGKRAYYNDTRTDGLQVAVTASGTRTFVLYRKINGKPTRTTLGRYPDLTPELARRKAERVRGQIAMGQNPQAEKRRERAATVTLGDAFETFLRARKSLKPTTVKGYRHVMTVGLGDWQRKRLTELTKERVAKRHAQLGTERGEAYANLCMRCLRAVWNFAAFQYEDEHGDSLLGDNPVKRLSQTRSWYRARRRTGVIRADQLPAWFEAVNALRAEPANTMPARVGDYLLFVLFTGLRRSEAATLTWEQVDLANRAFTLHDTKNREDHTLPLSDFVHELLSARAEHTASRFVFPGEGKQGHLQEPRYQMQRVIDQSGVDFKLHDLRRTFATIAENLEMSPYALKRLLNHKMGNDVTAGYIISDVERLRAPMQRITDFLLRAGGQRSGANVLAFKASSGTREQQR